MAQVTITAPVASFNGRTAGVQFTDGKATIADNRHAALEYFERHGFGISRDVKNADEPELSVEKQEPIAPAGTEPEAEKGKGKAPKAPAKGAGDGPVGPQHNLGHDGADPSNTGTPVTPNDEVGI